MVWDAIDQFVYVTVIFVSSFIYLYKRSEYLAILLVFVIFLLSQVLLLTILLTPVVIIFGVIVLGLASKKYVEHIYLVNNLTYKSVYFYELLVLIFGYFICFIFVVQLLSANFFKVFKSFDLFGYFIIAYSIVTLFKFMINLRQINKNNYLIYLQQLSKSPETQLRGEEAKLIADNASNMLEVETESINNAPTTNYVVRNKKERFISYALIVLLICILPLFLIIKNYVGFETYDAKAHSLLVYDTNSVEAEVEVLNGVEEFRSDGDYTKLYDEYEPYGYTKEDIDVIFSGLDSDYVNKLEDINLTYEISNASITNGDVVTITAIYDEEQAKEQKIKVTNPQYTVEINDLIEKLDEENINKYDFSQLDFSEYLFDYTYDDIKYKDIYANYDKDFNIVVHYTLENGYEKQLGNDEQVNDLYVYIKANIKDDAINIVGEPKVSKKLDNGYISMN